MAERKLTDPVKRCPHCGAREMSKYTSRLAAQWCLRCGGRSRCVNGEVVKVAG